MESLRKLFKRLLFWKLIRECKEPESWSCPEAARKNFLELQLEGLRRGLPPDTIKALLADHPGAEVGVIKYDA